MTEFDTKSRSRLGFKQKFAHAFRSRELILRSEGVVHYVRLGTGLQLSCAGVVLAATLWLVGANGLAWIQENRIEQKQAQIVEARVAYERLRGELSIYQKRIAALARDILAQHDTGVPEGDVDLNELADVTAGIENAFGRITRDLDLTEADRVRIIQSRDALHEKINSLEDSLRDAQERIAGLETDVAERDQQLDVERAEVAALTESRDNWRDRAEDLDTDLANANSKIESLGSELEITVSALSQEQSRVEDLDEIKDRLSVQVANLQSGLRQAEDRGSNLARNVAQLTENLHSLESERVSMESERETLSSDLSLVEAELSLHQTATDRTRARLEFVVNRLAELTNSHTQLDDEDSSALQALEGQIGDLAAELRDARNNVSDMETAIGDVVVELARVAGDTPSRLDAVDAPEEKVTLTRELLHAVASVQEDQYELIARLTEQADDGIARSESLLAMAGLDANEILRISGFEPGVGGPLEVVEEAATDGDSLIATAEAAAGLAPDAGPAQGSVFSDAKELASSIEILESRLVRVSALNEVMRCVPFISPVDNFQLTSPFGQRKDPITGQSAWHGGIDIGGWAGIKVHATAPGVVTFAGKNSGYGFMVEIDHGCGIKTVYAHLRRIKVKVGDEIEHRTVIGTLGSTGRSTGPHVHYEINVDGKRMDPVEFIEAGRHVLKI